MLFLPHQYLIALKTISRILGLPLWLIGKNLPAMQKTWV